MPDADGGSPIIHLEQLPKDVQFLLALLSQSPAQGSKENVSRLYHLLDQPEDFLRLVRLHHVTWHTASRLESTHLDELRSCASALKASLPEQYARAMRTVSTLKSLSKQFQRYGIRFIPLKGVVLGQMLYGDFCHRHSGDLDLLLLDPKDLFRATEVMNDCNYHPAEMSRWPTPARWKLLVKRHNHISLAPDRDGPMVELHWRAASGTGSLSNVPDESTLTSVEVAGESYLQFGREQLLLYLACHGSKHAWASLHWLDDFVLLAATFAESEWERVADLAEEWGYRVHLALSVNLAVELLGLRVPDGLRQTLGNLPREPWFRGVLLQHLMFGKSRTSREVLNMTFYTMRLEPTLKRKWGRLTRDLLDINDWDRLNLPDSLHFLYYFFRPVSWFYRRIIRRLFAA